MQTFTDGKGRPWNVELNVFTIMKAKDMVGVDLAKAFEDRSVFERLSDPVTATQVIYAVVNDQMLKENVSAEDFGRSMFGKALDDAAAALVDELLNFSPPSSRMLAQQTVTAARGLKERMLQRMLVKMEDPQLLDAMEKSLTSGMTSGNSPASAEFTPDPTPIASSS